MYDDAAQQMLGITANQLLNERDLVTNKKKYNADFLWKPFEKV